MTASLRSLSAVRPLGARAWRVRAVVSLVALAAAGCDTTAPPKPTSIVLMGGATSGIVNQPMDPSPSFEIRDEKGNRMGGVAFTILVTSGGGSVAASPLKTVGDGPTSIGTWTLGTAAGPQAIQVQTSGLPAFTIAATARPGTPTSTSSGGGPLTANGLVGAVAVIQPSIQVQDAFGNPVSGVTVNVTTTGGGTVQTTNPVTNATGLASAGIWTLGTTAGEQTARLSIGQTAPVVLFRVQAEPGSPSAVSAATAQTTVNATVGQPVQLTPSVRVTDQFGNGIAGVAVSAVASAGSTVSTPNAVTNASGVASAGLWTVGQAPGAYTVTMTAPGFAPVVFTANALAPPPNQFNITVRYFGGTQPTAALQNAIIAAVARVEQVVTGDVPDQPIANANLNGCFPGVGVLNEVVDDLVVYVTVAPVDGLNNTLAFAGPCFPVRASAPRLPIYALVQVDSDDLASMTANGTLQNVVLHELLHAVGFGSLWAPFAQQNYFLNFISGSGTVNPMFTGAAARVAYVAAGGTLPGGVPVDNSGQGGTGEAHWRIPNFGNELMIGSITPGVAKPMSAVTIQSLADLGYQVNVSGADPFTVVPGGQAGIRSSELAVPLRDDVRVAGFITDWLGRPWVPAPVIQRGGGR